MKLCPPGSLLCTFFACLVAVAAQWEVINDVKPFDDSGSQDDILSQEELIPFKPSNAKPKSKPNSAPRQHHHQRDSQMVVGESVEVRGGPRPGAHSSRGGGDTAEDAGIPPLGVAHDGRRRLLQVPAQGSQRAKISSADSESLKKLKLRSDAVNLSTNCKDGDDADCLFDVEAFLANQRARGIVDHSEQDFLFGENSDIVPVESQEEATRLSRHKRQSVVDAGSGTGPIEDLYANVTSHENEGNYKINHTFGLAVPNGATFDVNEKEKYRTEIEKELKRVFGSLPGYVNIEVQTPVMKSGVLTAEYVLTVNGTALAKQQGNQVVGSGSLEDYLLLSVNTSIVPQYNRLTIFNTTIQQGYELGKEFTDSLIAVLGDYCGSADPCPDASPEFNVSACTNVGFMSGYCPHKCADYPCQNYAICELDSNYTPRCNCGNKYTGEFCQEAKGLAKGLTKGESVGVGVAAAAAAVALFSCCFFILFCRRRKRNVNYTYYEDEVSVENTHSDPTSIANYYIDRPIISTTPISVFNSSSGFEA